MPTDQQVRCPDCDHHAHYGQVCTLADADAHGRRCGCSFVAFASEDAYIAHPGPVTDAEADCWHTTGPLPFEHVAQAQRAVRTMASKLPFPVDNDTAITLAVSWLASQGLIAVDPAPAT